ncbi:zinc transporter ZIP1-like isoform X2 [Brienomyrus brachyistius]|uniref:zinc transporter ZIP1-like isoform X2 n=1 Tax=Brienomyrus brachyistius TaxID=42636 RepID=UPI0020B2FF53|nr:zinc transporter ZIP1-like isoform X2 [Brienomyrus brachyistius]
MTWMHAESQKSSTAFESGMDTTLGTRSGLEIKLVSLFVLLFMTLVSGCSALCIIRGRGRCNTHPETRCKVLSLASCFAGGVFLATCLLDLVPDYLVAINKAFSNLGITLQFPLPEFILAMGFFLVLVMEQIVLVFRDKTGGFTGERDEPDRIRHPSREGVHLHVDFNSHSAIRSFILVFSLSLHSVFEGLAVGLQQDKQQILEICLALLLHKSVISFSLALKLTQGHLRQAAVAGCLLLFSAMSPLGIGLGIALTETQSTPQHQLARSTLDGLAAGTFIYITFMEILPHELGSSQNRVPKLALLLTGFAVVTGFLFIKI